MHNWTGQYTWTLENYSEFENDDDSTKSPEFEIGGYTWHLLLYPFGNPNDNVTDYVSLYLELPYASSTPVHKCPGVFFELSIVNQFDAAKTFKRVAGHFYTNHSPSWGYHDMILTSTTEDPGSGFVVDDCLIVEVKILVIEDDTIPNSKPATLQRSAASQSNRQELIYLNVGGQSFKMAKSTVERFPESLLCKMVEEFPDLVEKREELYIDRNPKAFPWIQEIYRDGDFEGTLPDMPFKLLQKELDFYQLPLAEELGIKQKPNTNLDDGFLSPMVKLFYEIMAEIKACNLCDSSSFSVFVYYRQVGNRKEGRRRVFVVPPDNFTISQCLLDRGHGPFDKAINAGPEDVTAALCSNCKVICHPATGERFRVLDVEDDKMIELLNEEASKFGMTVSRDSYTRGKALNLVAIGFLNIEYT